MNDILPQIMQALDDPNNVTGIVVHGFDLHLEDIKHSEIAILIIQNHADNLLVEDTRLISGTLVDVCSGNLATLRNRLHKRDFQNNNFILNLMRNGQIYLDRTGDAALLKADTDELWKSGPPAMTEEDINRSRKNLNRMLLSAKRLSRRAGLSRQEKLLAEMRLHQVVAQSIYVYRQVRRHWTDNLPHMLRRLKKEDSTFFKLWEGYVNARSLEQRIQAATLMVDAV